MELITRIAVPLLVVALGAGLMVWHIAAWRRAREEEADEPLERDFQWRRFRRRIQTSGMIVLIGLALGAVMLIDPAKHPLLIGWFLLGMLILLLWIVLLAVADMASTRSHVTRMKHYHMVETAKLQAALRRAKEQLREEGENDGHEGNGADA